MEAGITLDLFWVYLYFLEEDLKVLVEDNGSKSLSKHYFINNIYYFCSPKLIKQFWNVRLRLGKLEKAGPIAQLVRVPDS